MRPNTMPANFSTYQQDTAFAFFDEVYIRGPMIGALIGGAGVGKSHAEKMYKQQCRRRHLARLEGRRVIVRHDALRRFRAAGFQAPEDIEMFEGRWPKEDKSRRSEAEIIDMIHWMGRERDILLKDLPQKSPEDQRPCPIPVIITPSQTTTASGLMKLIAREVLQLDGTIFSCEDARHRLLSRLIEQPGHYLIVDEAQRLRPEVLNVLREPYDDAQVSVVLVGTEDLKAKLHQGDAKSLLSRISIMEELRPLTEDQTIDLLSGWDQNLLRRVYAHTGGVFRRIENLARMCEQLCENNGQDKVTEEILNEAVQMVPDLLPDHSQMRFVLGRKVEKEQPRRGGTPQHGTASGTEQKAAVAAG